MKIQFETDIDFENEKIKDLITPKPLNKILPKWFVKTKNTFEEKDNHILSSLLSRTVKRCMPVFDYLSCGYCIPSWEDMFIYKNEQGVVEFKTKSNTDGENPKHPATQFLEFAKTSVFEEYYGERDVMDAETLNVPKILNIWTIKTPTNYSCLFMRPFYHEQKINILPGIVDTDSYKNTVNFPFFVNMKKNESFVIKIGTPLVYVFPFKRDNWEIEVQFGKKQAYDGIQLVLTNYYKNFVRKSKKYV